MNVVTKIIIGILVVLLLVSVMVIAYFFLFDIESKLPKNIEKDCTITSNEFMGRKIFKIDPNMQTQNKNYILYFHGGSYVAEATRKSLGVFRENC